MAGARKRTVPFSYADTAWLRMEHPTNLMVITGVLMFDEVIDFERLKAMIERRLLRFHRFRQRAVDVNPLGRPYWEDDPDFDIRSHVHRIGLPSPGDQTALEELVSDLMSTPLDFSRPLWQFHLVENYGSGCALIARLHHCIADGIALVQVLLSLTDAGPDEAVPGAAPEQEAAPPDMLASLTRSATSAVRSTLRTVEGPLFGGLDILAEPTRALELAKVGVDGTAALNKLLFMPPDPPTLFRGKLGVAKRVAWSTPIPLSDLKQVGQFTGGTINDLLLNAVTGALRRYVIDRGAPVDGGDIRAVIPVNLRPLESAPELGNRFGLVFLPLPIGIEDPLERLSALKYRMDAIKGTPEAVVAFGILNVIGMMPAELETQAINMFGQKATAVMTNVPGPRETIYMAGKPIRGIMFWVPQSGRLGLGVSILSYAGAVLLGVATDARLVPDPETIVAGFHREFDQLMKLVR